MGAFKPEFSQKLIGNKWGDYEVPDGTGEMLYKLAKILRNGEDDGLDASYGAEYSNDVFEMHPYYWGDCTCGFDDEEEKWRKQHKHKSNCFHVKLEKYEKELMAAGIDWLGDRRDEYHKLVRKFAIRNGYIGGVDTIWNYCDCGYKSEYEKWLATHDHSPDCPIVVPNFLYKPTGLEIRWYQYIGRGMSANREINLGELRKIITHCIRSVKKDMKKSK